MSSARSSHGSRRGKRTDLLHAARSQHTPTGFERCSRRTHVVNEDHNPCTEVEAGLGVKRITDVPMALGGWQFRLRAGCPNPAESRYHRRAQLSRQVFRLVESAGSAPGAVKGHRDDCVGATKNIGASLAHESAQWARDRPPAIVLEGVHDRAKSPVVGSSCLRAMESGPIAPAARAAPGHNVVRPPRGQRITAALAKRGTERRDGLPARCANRPAGWTLEGRRAGGAARSEQRRQQRIGDEPRLCLEAVSAPLARRYPTGVRARRTGVFRARRRER
jgi:hypothetical protein